jgi:hypothetical protein
MCCAYYLLLADVMQIIDELYWLAFKAHHEAKRARAVEEKKRQAAVAAQRAQEASLVAAAAPTPPSGQPDYEVSRGTVKVHHCMMYSMISRALLQGMGWEWRGFLLSKAGVLIRVSCTGEKGVLQVCIVLTVIELVNSEDHNGGSGMWLM